MKKIVYTLGLGTLEKTAERIVDRLNKLEFIHEATYERIGIEFTLEITFKSDEPQAGIIFRLGAMVGMLETKN